MARGRIISKSLSTSQKYAALYEVAPALAEFCQALFPLLVAHADDFGRLPGDPFTVKHMIMPTSPRVITEFAAGLTALDSVGLLAWYEADGRKFIQIMKFDDHQPGLHKRTRSQIPDPPMFTGCFPEIPSEGNRTELNRTEQKRDRSTAAIAGGFDVFWESYPLKVGKVAARKVWDQITPDAALLTVILSALRVQCASAQWQRDGGQYVPHPRTWLHQQRWTDEVETATPRPASCKRGHQPPCADEAICSRIFLAELNAPVEVKA